MIHNKQKMTIYANNNISQGATSHRKTLIHNRSPNGVFCASNLSFQR